jgi:hypothetical protein
MKNYLLKVFQRNGGLRRSAVLSDRRIMSGMLFLGCWKTVFGLRAPFWTEYGELNSVQMLTAVVDGSARLLKLIATGTDHWGALEAKSEKHRAMYSKMGFCFAVGVWKRVRSG